MKWLRLHTCNFSENTFQAVAEEGTSVPTDGGDQKCPYDYRVYETSERYCRHDISVLLVENGIQ